MQLDQTVTSESACRLGPLTAPAVKEIRVQLDARAGAFVRVDMAPGAPLEWFGDTWPAGARLAALTPLLDAAALGAPISLDDLHRARDLAVRAQRSTPSPR